jgi:hypothetical protein
VGRARHPPGGRGRETRGEAEPGPVRDGHRRPAGLLDRVRADVVRRADLALHEDRLGHRPRPALGPGAAVRGADPARRGRPGRPR